VKTFAARAQLDVSFEQSGTLIGRPGPEPALALFRVLQECLSNTVKHAQAKKVAVKLHFAPEAILLSVKDDGAGFDPQSPRPGHYGLINMRERAMKLGGEVTIDSSPGQGAQVTFSVPLS
jgi:signal transduction histidine kinase